MGAVGLGASIGLGLYGAYQQNKAAEQAEKANKERAKAAEAQRRVQELQNRRQRTQQIRQQRVARAEVESAAQARNVAGSSSATQAGQATVTGLASNLSFLDQTAGLGNIASDRLAAAAAFENRAIRAQNRAGIATGLSGLGFSGVQAFR